MKDAVDLPAIPVRVEWQREPTCDFVDRGPSALVFRLPLRDLSADWSWRPDKVQEPLRGVWEWRRYVPKPLVGASRGVSTWRGNDVAATAFEVEHRAVRPAS